MSSANSVRNSPVYFNSTPPPPNPRPPLLSPDPLLLSFSSHSLNKFLSLNRVRTDWEGDKKFKTAQKILRARQRYCIPSVVVVLIIVVVVDVVIVVVVLFLAKRGNFLNRRGSFLECLLKAGVIVCRNNRRSRVEAFKTFHIGLGRRCTSNEREKQFE